MTSGDRVNVNGNDDTRLSVRRWGAGPAVLLLHGLAGSGDEMIFLADKLAAKGRTVLVPDLRGHGLSEQVPVDVSVDTLVEDVWRVADSLVPGVRVSLVGQSLGGLIAMVAAAIAPSRVGTLALIETVPAGQPDPDFAHEIQAYFASWPLPFASRAEASEFLGDSAIARSWVDGLEQHPDGYRPRFTAATMGRMARELVPTRWEEWSRVHAPTLAIFGERGMFTPSQIQRLADTRPETACMSVRDAGHDVHLDQPEALFHLLDAFLPRQGEGSPA